MNPKNLSFAELGLNEAALKALNQLGYETPSPIQAACIPPLLGQEDLLGQAQTGTGKTAAFALPFLEKIDLQNRKPQWLTLTPTRELSIQVAEAYQAYARFLPDFHVMPLYGGQNISVQLKKLKNGAQAVVGTPGRIMDHLRRGSLNLESVRFIVLDEADEMLKMGFLDDVDWILEHLPPERQTALFSATMSESVLRVARRHLRNPLEIKIKTESVAVAAVEQTYIEVSGLHKLDMLTRILETEDMESCLIFVRTKKETEELAEKLRARGFETGALNGDMKQADRERTISALKSGKLDIVAATDVAARGLDVERISHVINYDIPHDVEAYVHRIGRTGRAGRSGKAILFVAPREKRMLKYLENAVRKPMERMRLPSREAVTNRRIEKFQQEIRNIIDTEDLTFCRDVVARMGQEEDMSALQIASALTFIAQKKRPLRLLEETGPRESGSRETRSRESGPRETRSRDTRPRESRTREPGSRDTRPRDSKTRSEESPNGRRTAPERDSAVKDLGMVRYRLDAGFDHGTTAADIVGAIANEAGIESRYFGAIDIHADHSFVELPEGMPREIFQMLKKTRLRERPMDIRQVEKSGGPVGRPPAKKSMTPPKKGNKSRKKSKLPGKATKKHKVKNIK